ncbi:MAG: DNA gyrase inhibitor YacG [Tepidisphaeraceae bacterium]
MKCPTCKKPVDDSTVGQPGSTFPFCCDRCRLIDLGRWLDGKYQIPVSKNDAEESEDESTPQVPKRGTSFRFDEDE